MSDLAHDMMRSNGYKTTAANCVAGPPSGKARRLKKRWLYGTVTLEPEYMEEIDAMAKSEMRPRANMLTVLIVEAVMARRKNHGRE